MDAFEAQVMIENQNQTRLRVLAHLQAALRESEGYSKISLTLEPENMDSVLIVYDGAYAREHVNIECDSELAMILDIVKKIIY